MKNTNSKAKPDFVLIRGERIRISTIKKYKPGETIIDGQKYSIQIYFSVNRMNEKISVGYRTKRERDSAIRRLDNILNTYLI